MPDFKKPLYLVDPKGNPVSGHKVLQVIYIKIENTDFRNFLLIEKPNGFDTLVACSYYGFLDMNTEFAGWAVRNFKE